MQQIRLKKRTAAERTAYLEGYYAGLNDGLRREPPVVVVAAKVFAKREAIEEARRHMLEQSASGLIVVPKGFEYIGTVGANPEIRVLYDNDREDGYWEEDE